MNRLTIIFFCIILLAACQKDVGVSSGQEVQLSYTLRPDIQFEVKSGEGDSASPTFGSASEINVLWYGVYHKKTNGEYVYMSDMSAFVEVQNPADIRVPITLIKDQEYEIVFVAQHRIPTADDRFVYMYTISEEAAMTRNSAATVTSGEQLDVFVYFDRVGPVTGNLTKNITLERPVAQINIGTLAATLPTDLDATFSNVPESYDIRNCTYSGTTSFSLENLVVEGDLINVNDTDYTRLSTLYILGGNQVGMTISTDCNQKIINRVDTAPNFKTNIVGNI